MTEGTMGGVNHQHRDDPHNVFGEMFRRGATVTPDGGERDGVDTMADLSHEPPAGADVNEVWSRGQRVDGTDR
jgi:hypothetical protein